MIQGMRFDSGTIHVESRWPMDPCEARDGTRSMRLLKCSGVTVYPSVESRKSHGLGDSSYLSHIFGVVGHLCRKSEAKKPPRYLEFSP
jgi:hypothetical protein